MRSITELFSYIRTHTFSKIILTFVAILTGSLTILGAFSYYAYRASLLQNAVESGQTSVEFIMDQIDNEIQNLHYATLSILNNQTLSNFENYRKSQQPDSIFKLKKMMEEIKYLETASPTLESIWLYNTAEDSFITRYGAFSQEEFFGKRYRFDYLSGKRLQNSLQTASPFRYLGSAVVTSFYETVRCDSFMRTISDYAEKPVGQIILNVNSQVFSDTLDKAALRNDLAVLLLDADGHLISSSKNAAALSDGAIAQISDTTEPVHLSLSGESYTGWITRSPESGMQYLALVNQKLLFQQVNSIRFLTIGLAFICLLLSGILAFSLTKRLFAPIRNIVRYILAEQGTFGTASLHDAVLIEQFINYMKSQNIQLQGHIDHYASMMQEVVLTELLYSQEQQPVMELYQRDNFALHFPYEQFTVAVIPFDQSDFAGNLPVEGLTTQLTTLAQEDAFRASIQLQILQQSERLLLILNTKAGTDWVQRYFELLKADFDGKPLLFGYGKSYPAVTGLYDSFHQAINVLMIKAAKPEGAALEDAINACYITSDYPQESELRLMRLCKSRNSGDAPVLLLEEIIRKNKENGVPDLCLESLFVQLTMTINRIIAEMNLDSGAVFGEDVNHYRILDRFPTIAEKEQYIFVTFDKLLSFIRSSKSGKTMETYQLMLDYVAEHYTGDLSLNDISYQLELSPSYLSNLFKECHHITFLDYVNKYRIAKAKPLLLGTDSAVAVIAAKVGYQNVNTFIRIFKKEEGVTPGQYRFSTEEKK